MLTAKEAYELAGNSNKCQETLEFVLKNIRSLAEVGEFSYNALLNSNMEMAIVSFVSNKLKELGYDTIINRQPKSITLTINWSYPK